MMHVFTFTNRPGGITYEETNCYEVNRESSVPLKKKAGMEGLSVPERTHKHLQMADDGSYMTEIPTCQSGSSLSGKLLFPVGAMLECWENCPDFHLDDGSLVVSFGGGLSGLCIGESINLQTGDVISHKGMTKNGKPMSWQHLANVSAPFRTRAERLFRSEVTPKDIRRIKPIPREGMTYRKQINVR